MILAVLLRFKNKLSLFSAMDAIENALVNLEDIADFLSIASQLEWEKIVKSALHRFIVSDMSNHKQFSTIKEMREKALVAFMKMAIEYRARQSSACIRGPDGLSWDFYHSNGGCQQLASFLNRVQPGRPEKYRGPDILNQAQFFLQIALVFFFAGCKILGSVFARQMPVFRRVERWIGSIEDALGAFRLDFIGQFLPDTVLHKIMSAVDNFPQKGRADDVYEVSGENSAGKQVHRV